MKELCLSLLLLLAAVTVTAAQEEVAAHKSVEAFGESLAARARVVAALQFTSQLRVYAPLASDPVSCASVYKGLGYFNTVSNVAKVCDGTAWQSFNTSALSGSGSSGRLPLWSSSSALTSDAGLTYTGTGSTFDVSVGRNLTAKLFTSAPQALTDAATVTWDLNAGQYATITLGGNRTLSITSSATGKSGCLVITQDGTGGRTLTLPGGSKVSGGGTGAVTLSTAAGAVDVLCVLYIGSTPYFNLGANYN